MKKLTPSQSKPWLKHYNPEWVNNPVPACTMYDQLIEGIKGHEQVNAIKYYGTNISYGELRKSVDHYADAFIELGIKAGEYISFITVSIPESMFSIYALNKIGAVCNFIDVRTDSEHINEYVAKAKSKTAIVLDIAYEKLAPHIDELGLEHIIVQSAGDYLPFFKKMAVKMKTKCDIPFGDKRLIKNKDFEKLGNGVTAQAVKYEPQMPAVVTRTGGTTGKSKGVVLTNDSMNTIFANFRDAVGYEEHIGTSLLNFLPLGSSYGIACGVHMAFAMTLENILIPKFKPEDFADLIVEHRPNHIIGVPIFYDFMMQNKKMQNMDLSFIQIMAAGGDTANPDFEKNIIEFTRARGVKYPLCQGYGMSETSSACSFEAFEVHRDTSVGLPCVHNTIGIFKPGTTTELGIGELGEICISGPTLMKEYLDEPEETADVMWTHPDGTVWVHSGDIGIFDEDGFLYIKGRIKRSIIRFDGHKCYPVQIENVVARHEAVKFVSVVPIVDLTHEQGELPLIIVEKNDDAEIDDKALVDEIMALCKECIEERSQPAAAIVIKKMPVTNNGKINYKKVGEKYRNFDYLK